VTDNATSNSNVFPHEVVTKALLRSVTVPGLDRPAALITLDNGFDHTKPNTFGPGGLIQLGLALDKVEDAAKRGEIVGDVTKSPPSPIAARRE